jgi:hypothetical protein
MGNVSGNYSVTQTFTRNVEQADIKHAKKHEGESLAKAPNQNIETGTRGAFKSSLSFFGDSLKGFFDTPFGKKLQFLKDRIELRSIQKGEVAEQKTAERCERRDESLTKGTFRSYQAPSFNETGKALKVMKDLGDGNPRLFAELGVSLGKWLGEIEGQTKHNGTDMNTEANRFAASLASNVGESDFKALNLPRLKDAVAQLRSEHRHEKANLLEKIADALGQVITQDKAVEKFHDTAKTYIQDYKGLTQMFWRNNNSDGEKALKSMVTHGFINELGNKINKAMRSDLQSSEFRSIDKRAPHDDVMNEKDAKAIAKFAEKLLHKLESLPVTEQMRTTMEIVRDDIAQLRPEEKNVMTRQFFQNAIFLKGIATADATSTTFKLAVKMMNEALNPDRGGDTNFNKESAAFREKFGQRMEGVLTHFGMPEYSRRG